MKNVVWKVSEKQKDLEVEKQRLRKEEQGELWLVEERRAITIKKGHKESQLVKKLVKILEYKEFLKEETFFRKLGKTTSKKE